MEKWSSSAPTPQRPNAPVLQRGNHQSLILTCHNLCYNAIVRTQHFRNAGDSEQKENCSQPPHPSLNLLLSFYSQQDYVDCLELVSGVNEEDKAKPILPRQIPRRCLPKASPSFFCLNFPQTFSFRLAISYW